MACSLAVFCVGIVLAFCAHAAIDTSLNSLWVQIFVGTIAILFLTASAYLDMAQATRSRTFSQGICGRC